MTDKDKIEASRDWWKTGVIYQIYPRSFQDTNGDGIGDLGGITQRLDKLAWLGVDALWISPFFRSPMRDFGYDVSDFTTIDPVFGTLADFDALVWAAAERSIKIILDLVPNHTSDEHPWFVESRSSRQSAKRDWYVWADPKPDGAPPSNWQSVTGGSSWAWDEASGQYYLHSFLPFQPDLNWRNPAVREAMYEVLRFWLDRGVAGFRIDMVEFLIKDAFLRDEPARASYAPDPAKPWYTSWYAVEHVYSSNRPETHEIMREIRRIADSYGGRVLIGEVDFHLPLSDRHAYYGACDAGELHLPFNFDLIATPWNAEAVREAIGRIEEELPAHGWPNWVLGNHDVPRVVTRIGETQARAAAVLLLTLRGTPFLYYGDELGMASAKINPEDAVDPWEKHFPGAGRDGARTPMHWDWSSHAGFCDEDVRPWLPIGDIEKRKVLATQAEEPRSMLSLYRRLIHLRRERSSLEYGNFEFMEVPSRLLAFRRAHGKESTIVIVNFGDEVEIIPLPLGSIHRLLSTHDLDPVQFTATTLTLRGSEAVVLGRVDEITRDEV